MKKIIFTTSILLLSIIIFPSISLAAELFFSSPRETKAGENLELVITLDTGGEFINSIELVINYDNDLLSFDGYSDENSIIKLYIDPPHSEQKERGVKTEKIYLSGIIPGGVQGLYDPNRESKTSELSPLPLVHLFFRTKKDGNAKFSFENSKILKNDGLGTSLTHEQIPTEIIIVYNPDFKIIDSPVKAEKKKKDLQNNALYPSTVIFLIFLILMSLSILVYKLLKYRYGKTAR